ncbi:uncharacterized protein V6R79_001604 [Siganus canaliculatus]
MATSVQFSGWEVVSDGACPGVKLETSQKPQRRGIYKMYHGTSIAAAKLIIPNGFQPSSGGMLGPGVYVSRDMNKAARYPLNSSDSDRVIFELRVRPGRVKKIDKDSHSLQFTWHANGYDTAWIPPNCGLRAVPSGLEEDCVFDPKRVEVVAIAKAPNDNIEKELKRLLANTSKSRSKKQRGADGSADVCLLCKRKTQPGAPHIKQQCWVCGQSICSLMMKHFCQARP